MKKLHIIITALLLSTMLFGVTQAAIGIPDYLVPNNVGMKTLNKDIAKSVTDAPSTGDGNQQDKAVAGFNIVLQYIANLLLFFAAPLAVLFIARAGSDYAFAMGEEDKMGAAKRELTWAILGLILVMFSYLIVRLMIQPVVGLQQATNDKLPSGGTPTAGAPAATTPGAPSDFEKNLDANIQQVEQNAANNPNAKATMYDPSGNLNGVNAQITNDGSKPEYHLDGKTVSKEEFTQGLKDYAAKKAAKK